MKKIFIALLFFECFFPFAYPNEVSVLNGTWYGYYILKDSIIKQLEIKYIFFDDGTWCIQKGEKKAEKQGWYKIDKNVLLLQMAESAIKNENTAVFATLKNNNSFEIRNPIDAESKLLFCESRKTEKITQDILSGKWEIMQKNLLTDEVIKANFLIVFDKEGKYTIHIPEKKCLSFFPPGTYLISGATLFLRNQFKGKGLWQTPTFFLFEKKLIFNSNSHSIWCEKIVE